MSLGDDRLGAILLRRGLIQREQLDQALGLQIIYGGRIGTILVEQHALNMDDLGNCLGFQLNVPVAQYVDFASATPQTLSLVSRDLCAACQVFPLRYEEGTLHVAMLEPTNLRTVDELSTRLEMMIKPYVVPELRLIRFLERRYGIRRDIRFTELNGSGSSDSDTAAHFPMEPEESASELGLVYLDDVTGAPPKRPRHDTLEIEFDVQEPQSILSVGSLAASLEDARDRDAIIDLLVAPFDAQISISVLFMVRNDMALGLVAGGTSASPDEVRGLVLPLGTPSLLSRALKSRQVVGGDAREDHTQQVISRYLGAAEPGEACVGPILLGTRVVNLLCVQTQAGMHFDRDMVDKLSLVCQRAAVGYVRLMWSLKEGGNP